jgi:histidine triad (HIT) family protein
MKEEIKERTIFEKIIDKEIPVGIIYEDEKAIAFLDAFPFSKGHVLVVPKKPYKTIFDMPEEDFLYLQKIVLKVAGNMRKLTGRDIAIFQRNGIDAGQEVPHVHVHVLPKYQSETENPVFNYGPGEALSEENKKYFKELLYIK